MIKGSELDPGRDPGAGGPDLARDTGDLRVIPGEDLALGAGGGQRAPGGGGLIPGNAIGAPGPGTVGRTTKTGNVQKPHRKATAVPDDLAVPAVNDTGEVVALLVHRKSPDLPRGNFPARRPLADTRKRKRRIKSARGTVIETGKMIGTEIGTNENVPPARRAKTKIRREIGSRIARRPM